MFRKLEFDTRYYAYLNKSQFKYYISILGGVGGLRPCLLCLFRGGVQNSGKPAYIILARSLKACLGVLYSNSFIQIYKQKQLSKLVKMYFSRGMFHINRTFSEFSQIFWQLLHLLSFCCQLSAQQCLVHSLELLPSGFQNAENMIS